MDFNKPFEFHSKTATFISSANEIERGGVGNPFSNFRLKYEVLGLDASTALAPFSKAL